MRRRTNGLTDGPLKNKYLSFKLFYQKRATKYIADQIQMGEEGVSTTEDWQGSLGDREIGSLCPEGKPVEGGRTVFSEDWHSTPHNNQ